MNKPKSPKNSDQSKGKPPLTTAANQGTTNRATPETPRKWLTRKWLIQRLTPSLLVSIVALFATFANHCSQDKKWDALNQPHFTLNTGPYFMAFEELDASAVQSRNWGYAPWFTVVQNNGVRTNKVHRNSELVWVRRDSPFVPAFFDTASAGGTQAGTVKEAEGEIAQRALNALKANFPFNKNDFFLKKHLQAHFEFRNSGSLPAKHTVLQIETKTVLDVAEPGGGQWQKTVTTDAADVPAAQLLERDVDLLISLELPLPKEEWFRFRYDWQDQKGPSVITIVFNFARLEWSLAPLS